MKPNIIEFIKKNDPGRIFSLFPDEFYTEYYFLITKQPPPEEGDKERRFMVWKETLYPNYHLLYGIDSIEIYDSLANRYISRYLALLGGRNIVPHIDHSEKLQKSNAQVTDKFITFLKRKPLADFLGIRYFVSGWTLENDPTINWPKNLRKIHEYQVPSMRVGKDVVPIMNIYENPEAKPMVYPTSITDFVSNDDEAFNRFKANEFRGIFVECKKDCDASLAAGGSTDIDISPDFMKPRNGRMEFSVNSSNSQFVVFSQNYYPGWKALLDGNEIPIHRVNAVFMGIFVPAGKHRVVFNYSYKNMLSSLLSNL